MFGVPPQESRRHVGKEHKINSNMSEIDWSNLSFGYMKTDYNVRCYYRNGAWGEIETCS